MTDFLKELEVQLTAAAHREASARARPRRPKPWPTLAFVTAAAVAVVAMILMPARGEVATDRPPANAKTASLKGVRIAVYNATTVNGVASSASRALERRGAEAGADTVPPAQERAYSTVYFAKGRAAQARSVMKALGIDRAGSPPPGFARVLANGRASDVVVVLGKDFVPPAKPLFDNFALLREATNRTIDTPAGPVRVVVSRAGLCLQVHDHAGWGGTCVDVAEALAGKAVVSLRRGDGRLRGAVGLVPDGVGAVELGQTDGTTRRLQVGRNVWAVGAETVISVGFDGKTIQVP